MSISSKYEKYITCRSLSVGSVRSNSYPVIFDKNNKFIYFPGNKVMQTTIARNLLAYRCIIYKNNSIIRCCPRVFYFVGQKTP